MTENDNVEAIEYKTKTTCGVCRFLWYLVCMRGEHRAMVRSLAEQLIKLERGEVPWETDRVLKPNTLAR